MIFGLGDPTYIADESYQPPGSGPTVDPLDTQIQALKTEIKALGREIESQSAAKQLNEDAIAEQKRKEITNLNRQVASFQKALELEQKRIQHYQTEIAKREGVLQPAPSQSVDAESVEEQISTIKAQNDALSQELTALQRELANECGENYDIDELLKAGGSAKTRADELQKLQAEFVKAQGEVIAIRVKHDVDRAADKAAHGLEQLSRDKAQLEIEIESMVSKIGKSRVRCDALEEESRALRMMDVLLSEKLKHDQDLIAHLREMSNNDVLVEEEAPPVTEEIIDQLRNQQMILRGLFYKLGVAQKELMDCTVTDGFGVLVDQLRQLNERCGVLQKRVLKQEMTETGRVESHLA
jgi:chromosome segregation ATPase